MGRLHKLVFVGGIGLCLLGAPVVFCAQSYCSLKIQVLTPDGKSPAALVEVREENGRKIEKEQIPGHDLEFCDLGILPVTVVVGIKDCELRISEVYLLSPNPSLTA
jgi:hypothetical protein